MLNKLFQNICESVSFGTQLSTMYLNRHGTPSRDVSQLSTLVGTAMHLTVSQRGRSDLALGQVAAYACASCVISLPKLYVKKNYDFAYCLITIQYVSFLL